MTTPTTSPTGDSERGVDAAWAACVAIAHARRTNGVRSVRTAFDGAWNAEAMRLFDLFEPLLVPRSAGGDCTIGQLGQSLDGCIATYSGDSQFVNGPEGLVHLHRLRALSDAVIVGTGTAVADDPQLTTRRVPGPNPVRVVLDAHLRVPTSARMFNDRAAPTWLVCHESSREKARKLWGADRVIALPAFDGEPESLSLVALKNALLERGLRILLVEGGGVTVSQFIRQGCLDRMHLLQAPVMVGGGRPGLQLPRAARLSDALRPAARTFALGRDVLWDLDFRAAQE